MNGNALMKHLVKTVAAALGLFGCFLLVGAAMMFVAWDAAFLESAVSPLVSWKMARMVFVLWLFLTVFTAPWDSIFESNKRA